MDAGRFELPAPPKQGKPRDRDDGDTLTLGRGASSTGLRDDHSEDDPRHHEDGSRWLDRDSRDRDMGQDPRDVFMRDLDLPRGRDREIVHDARGRDTWTRPWTFAIAK